MTTPFTFYKRNDVPAKWTLVDVLYWRACELIPEPIYDDSGTEYRNSGDIFAENILRLGKYFGEVYLEPDESQRIGLSNDPRYENLINEEEDGIYIGYVSTYESIIKNTFTDEPSRNAYIKENEQKLLRAKRFELTVKEWEQSFDDFLDRFRAELLIDLKDAKINCEAIRINRELYLYGEIDELVYDDFLQLASNQSEFENAFVQVPKGLWISRNLDWHGGYLRAENAVYLGLRFDVSDVLRQYPPKQSLSEELFVCGNGLVKPEAATNLTIRKTNRGRPSKNWSAVYLRIAEVIAKEGSLPKKQDAFAAEIVEWYRENQGEEIGLTTVKARLAIYYQNPIFKKS